MWKKGNPHALLVGIQIGAATVERVRGVLKKLKIEYYVIQQFHFWVFTQKKVKH